MSAPSAIASSLAADATRVSTTHHLIGVSLAGFATVVAAAGGRDALAGKTTAWLKYEHVIPATREDARVYVDLLLARPDGGELVGDATHFFSHAYDYAFLDAVDAAEAWARRNPRDGGGAHFFYFDLLVVNQHATAIVPFETLRDEFGGGVRGIGRTLFMLDYEQPRS